MVLVALMGISSANACIKKSAVSSLPADEDLVVIVMDTMQSLLPEAEVKIGKVVQRTSWDGRVVWTPAQWNEAKKMTIECKGHEAVSIPCSAFSNPLIVSLKPNKSEYRKTEKDRAKVGGERLLFRGKGEETEGAVRPLMVTAAMAEYDVADVIMPTPKGGGPNAAAGLLTAGEVNDFAKWSLWESYQSASVRFQEIWQLTPRTRYTVLVKTTDGYPAVNYPVNLTDANGNTLFQAMTDNTGKAELWADLTGEGLQVTGYRIQVDEQQVEAKEWKDGLNVFIVDDPCDAPQEVDVVFVFDATGSMGDELRYLQAEMKDVIARASDATGGLKIRTGAVVYRDHEDDYVTRISRLTADIATTQTFIDKQEAYGGGDYPEAVPEALMAALNSAGWNPNARARIAFLILDAPCHEDSVTLALMHDQIRNAAAMGVRIVPVVCSGIGESAEYLLRSMALATNGTSFFLTDDSGIGGEHLKPTTDSLVVEHLNDMLVRTIVEFSTMPSCNDEGIRELENEGISEFVPNPFETEDLEANPTLPQGEGVHYLVDMSGKLLGIFHGELKTYMLPKGVYLDKQYIDGKWYTKKVVVQ
jgi:hypothetical protein